MNLTQVGILFIIIVFIGFNVFIGRKGSQRNIGFLIPFFSSLISQFLGFAYIGLPIIFKSTFSNTVAIIILLISAFTGPLITLALTLTSEIKGNDI